LLVAARVEPEILSLWKTVSTHQRVLETWGLLQHIQKSTGFVSDVLFYSYLRYFVQVQVTFFIMTQSDRS
jgi:hypothetical protein